MRKFSPVIPLASPSQHPSRPSQPRQESDKRVTFPSLLRGQARITEGRRDMHKSPLASLSLQLGTGLLPLPQSRRAEAVSFFFVFQIPRFIASLLPMRLRQTPFRSGPPPQLLLCPSPRQSLISSFSPFPSVLLLLRLPFPLSPPTPAPSPSSSHVAGSVERGWR